MLANAKAGQVELLPLDPGYDQIQLGNSIRRVKVAIDVSTKAAEIGSITAKPVAPTATKPQKQPARHGLARPADSNR
jgi:hypothetical protein